MATFMVNDEYNQHSQNGQVNEKKLNTVQDRRLDKHDSGIFADMSKPERHESSIEMSKPEKHESGPIIPKPVSQDVKKSVSQNVGESVSQDNKNNDGVYKILIVRKFRGDNSHGK